MKKCPRCGYENPDDAQFCLKCHYPLFEMREINIEINEKELTPPIDVKVYYYLLMFSLLYVVSFFMFFTYYPSLISIVMILVNAVSTILLSMAILISKKHWLYFFVNLSPISLYLLLINKLIGIYVFSVSGLFISDFIRVIYYQEKDEILRVGGLILVIGYLGGLLYPLLYNMIIAGYLVLIFESITKIRERRKKLPSP